MKNMKVVPILCFWVVVIKYPLIPISPAYNWGRGQFLNVILWDSAAMNSEGSEIPTGPRKYDAD
jgi:hypothetical protein